MPPSDEEMIRLFNTHETAFAQIAEMMSHCPSDLYYPPYNENKDTTYLRAIPPKDRAKLDSLLKEIGSERIFYYKGSSHSHISVSYYNHGYSIGGTSKSFIHKPELRENVSVRITENGDLNEIYRRKFNDTTLYKLIKGNWCIELEHDN